jgi:hypothetical protein
LYGRVLPQSSDRRRAVDSVLVVIENRYPHRTPRLLKKTHMLRCARPTRFNVLKRTPQLIELRAPRL